MTIKNILRDIIELPENLHGAGTVSKKVLLGIYKYCDGIEIRNSLETGSGKTTLLFSHLSKNHLVFAVNDGDSIGVVKRSPLLNIESYSLVEGPTQLTLPHYQFKEKYQVVYLDGPHGYPFPDLEYYYLYPHIEIGGLLIIDDILIPTIYNLFKFLKDEEMFELLEVIGTTAFFRRTGVETFDPYGDGWWLQNYNKKRFPKAINAKVLIKSFLPESVKIKLKKILKYS